VRAELRSLVSELPQLMDEVAAFLQSSPSVERACQYYRAFIAYTLSADRVRPMPSLFHSIGGHLSPQCRPETLRLGLMHGRKGNRLMFKSVRCSCESTGTAMKSYRPGHQLRKGKCALEGGVCGSSSCFSCCDGDNHLAVRATRRRQSIGTLAWTPQRLKEGAEKHLQLTGVFFPPTIKGPLPPPGTFLWR